jgi:hypothetical protein
MSKLNSAVIPPVSRAVIEEMRRTFRGPEIKPGFDRDKAIHDAAQQKVVDWIEAKYAGDKVLTGDPAALEAKAEAQAPKQTWTQRWLAKAQKAAAIVVVGVGLFLGSIAARM